MLELQHISHRDLGGGGGTFYDAGAVGVGVLQDDSSSTKTEESKEDFVFFFKLFSKIRETDSLGSETEC